MERILLTSEILSLRQTLREKLEQVESGPLVLNIEPDVLDKIIFETKTETICRGYDCTQEIKKSFAIPFSLVKKLDLTGISFENVDVSNRNFANSFGVTINPQTVYRKDLSKTKLKSVRLDGSFDGCIITKTDFTGSINAVVYPDLVFQSDIRGTNFKDATVIFLDDAYYSKTDEKTSFKGAFMVEDNYFEYLETKIMNSATRKRK